MFYLKYNGKKLEITDENTYTRCPRCGKEKRVSLSAAMIDGVLDLCNTAVYCYGCEPLTNE